MRENGSFAVLSARTDGKPRNDSPLEAAIRFRASFSISVRIRDFKSRHCAGPMDAPSARSRQVSRTGL